MDSQGIKSKLLAVLTAEKDAERHKSQLEHLAQLERENSAHYADLKAEQLAKINKHKQVYHAAQKIIDKLVIMHRGQQDTEKTCACRTILTERYLNGKSWTEIARLTNYSERQAQRLHGAALEAAAKTSQRRKK